MSLTHICASALIFGLIVILIVGYSVCRLAGLADELLGYKR